MSRTLDLDLETAWKSRAKVGAEIHPLSRGSRVVIWSECRREAESSLLSGGEVVAVLSVLVLRLEVSPASGGCCRTFEFSLLCFLVAFLPI
jgi:hypothetical protein